MVSNYLQSAVGGRRKVGVLKVLKGAKWAIKEWTSLKSLSARNCVGSLEKRIHDLELEQAQGLGDSDSIRQIATLRGSELSMTKVSHLQFADDFMVFCEASLEQLNLKKCRIFGINVPDLDLECWVDVIGCKVGKSMALWDPVVDKIVEVPLRVSFPRVFVVCSSKHDFIADFGSKVDGTWSWAIPLRRQLFDWEVEQWNSLMTLLHGFQGNNFIRDWVRWAETGDGSFSVMSLVNKVNDFPSLVGEWALLVWRRVAPLKVEVFTWLVIRQRILVRVELAARARNDIIFSNVRFDFVQLLFLVKPCVASWYKAKFLDFIGSVNDLIVDPSVAYRVGFSKARVEEVRAWEAPPSGFLKLNVDGAMAECDSTVALDWISLSAPCPSAFDPLVRSCRELVFSHSVVLRHVSRCLDVEADLLAKKGIG
ncbi:hypothetical protein V6N12_064546 [Hibiscus sabdariffa]|uniref:Reverse transcriptase zinc-binding domain-containing protein n=1 Tax=Hibiscus sabdariffa TaxID=183260 RepID=A0ABR2G6B1_9ROSI